jgi:hypothetical protein
MFLADSLHTLELGNCPKKKPPLAKMEPRQEPERALVTLRMSSLSAYSSGVAGLMQFLTDIISFILTQSS